MVTIRFAERACYGRVLPLMDRGHEKVLQMRTLAARLRGHAAETSLEFFQHKFLTTAADLEKEARNAERRAPLVSLVTGTGPGYRH